MRILFITNFYQLYGANRSLLSIMEKFKESGDQVCLLLPKKGDYSEELDRKGIDYMVIPFFSQLLFFKFARPYLIWPFLSIATVILLPYIVFRVRKFRPDIIYSNTIADNIGIIIARVLGKKHITHVRDFMDLDHGAIFLFGSKAKKKYVSMSDGVVYVSRSVAEHTMLSKTLPPHHEVIYNGVKMDVNSRYEEKELPKTINLGIVGLLDESKGQHIAIEYFNAIKDAYPNAFLHLWGDKESPYKKRIFNMINSLGLKKRVIFHGFEKNTSIIYKDMSVLLMCSRAEGFGRVTVEAMANGIPVMGYNSGGTAELVKDGYNGYLFSNLEEFRCGFNDMFSSVKRYNQLCSQAYLDAHQHYSEAIYTNNVYSFVKELVQNKM